MDLQVHRGRTSTSDAQWPVVASVVYPSLEHWTSTSFQSPSSQEVLSISSFVPPSVLTLMPHCRLTADGRLQPDPIFCSEITSELQLPGTSSSTCGSSEARDQKTLMLPPLCQGNVQEVQQRKPMDGGPLEDGSIDLMFSKDLPEIEPGKNCPSV